MSLTAKRGTVRVPFTSTSALTTRSRLAQCRCALPTLLDFHRPSCEAITVKPSSPRNITRWCHHGELNSRWKDFYDVWLLAEKFEFDGVTLAQAIRATFQWRKTEIVLNPVAFSVEFAHNAVSQRG